MSPHLDPTFPPPAQTTPQARYLTWCKVWIWLTILALAACTQPGGNPGWTPSNYQLPPSGMGGADAYGGDGSVALADGSTAAAGDGGSTSGLDGLAAGEVLGDQQSPVDTGLVDVPPEALFDLDGDGYTPAGGDCDDYNTLVHPGATEVCDDTDNDCNGDIDDVDHDGDGYSQCPGPVQDCDDDDPAIYPGAISFCAPGKDGNCDGLPDMEEDFDGDGHPVCEDCDDKDPLVYPGSPPDCTGKKVDANCDGLPDVGTDNDGDGFSSCNDCNDQDPTIHLYALEVCNGKDEDCNGVTDDLDNDGDGYPACKIADFQQDCDDSDLTANPGALRNCKNGKDNDCSGIIDSQEDGDGDGAVGCQDCNDYNPSINPKSLEIVGDNIDNDCNGQTDEPSGFCDVAGLNSNVEADYAKAIDLCGGVVSSTFPTVSSKTARAIRSGFGPKNVPKKGSNLVVMSSGVAAAVGQAGYVVPQSGTSFSNSAPYPPVSCKNSGSVYDYIEWKLVLQVPGNAQAFAFDFNFMSAEYPEWVGTQFNDKFLAIVDSQKFKGNVSFDSKGNCISINNALFNECTGCSLGAAGLQGTGYDGGIGGGTGWLTTTSPVAQGETITIKFIIFDEGDHILDSVVLLDNFRWLAKSTVNSPSTIRPGS